MRPCFLNTEEKVVINYLNVFKFLWLIHSYRVGYSHDENPLKSEKWILSHFWILVMNTETITVRNLLEEENTSLVNTDLVQVATYVMPNLLSALTKCSNSSTIELIFQTYGITYCSKHCDAKNGYGSQQKLLLCSSIMTAPCGCEAEAAYEWLRCVTEHPWYEISHTKKAQWLGG